MENKVEVMYKGRLVGTLARYKDKYAFQYADSWIQNGFSISPFSLPLRKQVFLPKENIFHGFFGVFADSLPDAWGNLLLERYLRKKGVSEYDGLYRIASIGNGGMGALEYMPNYSMTEESPIELDAYQKEANHILDEKSGYDIDLLYRFGGSSGGARPKALVMIEDEDWIIKFQSHYDIENSGVCEYEYALCARELGIDMPEVRLFPSQVNGGYFGIKRFDRDHKEKIHMITAAALLEADFRVPCADYLDLFKLTRIITHDNKKNLENLYLRMCFNVYAHNLDDHLKNFSFLYDEKLNLYYLSPAYDMTYSTTYYQEHTTSVNHKGKNITLEDLVFVGVSSGLSKEFCLEQAQKIKDRVEEKLGKYLHQR